MRQFISDMHKINGSRVLMGVLYGTMLMGVLGFLLGCSTTSSGAKSVEEILTEPAKTRQCITADDLPACPDGTTQYIEYRMGRCVWDWWCQRRDMF